MPRNRQLTPSSLRVGDEDTGWNQPTHLALIHAIDIGMEPNGFAPMVNRCRDDLEAVPPFEVLGSLPDSLVEVAPHLLLEVCPALSQSISTELA